MNKKTVKDICVKGKKVVMRVDFNVPLNDQLQITDDTRVLAALPTIKYVLEQGAALVLMSHLGRPSGKGYEKDFSLKPVADYLATKLGKPVAFAADCQKADAEVAALKPGQVLMLENTRFYAAEEGKAKQKEGMSDEEYAVKKAEMKKAKAAMAEKLASYGDVYVNDAFGTAVATTPPADLQVHEEYRAVLVLRFLMQELDYLGNAVESLASVCCDYRRREGFGKLEILSDLMKRSTRSDRRWNGVRS